MPDRKIGCTYEFYKDMKRYGHLRGDIAYTDVNQLFIEHDVLFDCKPDMEPVKEVVLESRKCSCRMTLHLTECDKLVYITSEKTHPEYWKRKDSGEMMQARTDKVKSFLTE